MGHDSPPEAETDPAAPQKELLPAPVPEATAVLDATPVEEPSVQAPIPAEVPFSTPAPEAAAAQAPVPEARAVLEPAPKEGTFPREEVSGQPPLPGEAPIQEPVPEKIIAFVPTPDEELLRVQEDYVTVPIPVEAPAQAQVPEEPVGPEVPPGEPVVAVSPESQPPDLSQSFRMLEDRLTILQDGLALLQKDTESLLNQQGIIQRSMRQMNVHINEVATTVSAPRIRELYLRLLLLYDLVEPASEHLTKDAGDFCKLLAGQIEEFLAVNGIKAIATDGLPFEARMHKAVGVAPADADTPEGTIVETRRKGFQSDNQILRPADVVIAKGSAAGVTEKKPSADAPPDNLGTDGKPDQ